MKNEIIRFRCSERDKAELQKQAEEKQMSMSEYLIYLIRKNENRKENDLCQTKKN